MALMMRVKSEMVKWLLENSELMGSVNSTLCTLPQVADSMSVVNRSMGFRSKTEQTRAMTS